MKINAKQKHLITIAIVAIIFVVIIIFVIYPTISKIISINKTIVAKQAELERKLAMGLNIKKTKQDLTEVQKSLAVFEVMTINPGEELDLITQLESMASRHSVTININSDFVGQKAFPVH